MTRRENFLNALRKRPYERMPFTIVIDPFNYPMPVPEALCTPEITSFSDPAGYAELQKYLGCDVLFRISPQCYNINYTGGAFNQWASAEDGSQIITFGVNDRQLSYEINYTPGADTQYQKSHAVKCEEDYKLLTEYFSKQTYSINPAGIEEDKRYLKEIGNDGICYNCIPNTPYMDLARTWVGIEQFIYDLADYTETVEETMNVMAEKAYEQCEIICANTPCEVLVFWDDCNSLYMTPRQYKKYCMPVHKRFAEIAHKYNKIIVCHTCGKINAFLDLLPQTGLDAVDWVAPIPIGDVIPSECQKKWDGKMFMMLSLDPDTLKSGSAEDVKKYLEKIMDGVDVNRGMSILVSAPKNSPIENYKAVAEYFITKHNIPMNRSSIFGSVFD